MPEETPRRRTVRASEPKTNSRAVQVDAEPLRLRGVHEFAVQQFIRAVEIAWSEATERLPGNAYALGEAPTISLHLKHPALDPRNVTATIGDGGLGSAEGTTPAALQLALVKLLAERFGNA